MFSRGSADHRYPGDVLSRYRERDGLGYFRQGFQIVLSPEVPNVIASNVGRDLDGLLSRHGLKRTDIGCWMLHTGGPKILRATAQALGVGEDALWASWECLAEMGNLSSSSVLMVLEKTMAKRPAPGTWSILAAMGPAFCSEFVLFAGRCIRGRQRLSRQAPASCARPDKMKACGAGLRPCHRASARRCANDNACITRSSEGYAGARLGRSPAAEPKFLPTKSACPPASLKYSIINLLWPYGPSLRMKMGGPRPVHTSRIAVDAVQYPVEKDQSAGAPCRRPSKHFRGKTYGANHFADLKVAHPVKKSALQIRPKRLHVAC